MGTIYKFKNNQPIVWFHRLIEKSNQWCLYCGEPLGQASSPPSNREHLIAREFVPTGYMTDKCFNFIFRACVKCNSEKSNLERHISSISLINSPSRKTDIRIDEIAIHKASKDFHPNHKGKSVIESTETTQINFNSFIKFGLLTPPQAHRKYVEDLASYHIQGLFSLITTSNPLSADETRLLPVDQIHFHQAFNVGDWGNPQLLTIINRTKNWPCYCNIQTADGYFKAILKSSPTDDDGWFWALEWNKYLRIVGGIYTKNKLQNIFLNLPELEWNSISTHKTHSARIRKESPLIVTDELFQAEVVQE